MSLTTTLKSLTVATAVVLASSAAFAQATGTTGAPQKQNNSATPAPPSGTDGKAPAQRTAEKGSMAAPAMDSASASKQNDSKLPLPASKTGATK